MPCTVLGFVINTDGSQLVSEQSTQCKGTVGFEIELYCSFNDIDNGTVIGNTYEWQKAGKTLRNSSEAIKFIFNYSDAGSYKCKAFADGEQVLCGLIALTTGKFVVAIVSYR